MQIRTARSEDVAAIEAVHFASRDAVYRGRIPDWPEVGPPQPERLDRWRQWLADPDITTLVAEVRGEVVGLVTVRATVDDGEDPSVVAEMPTLYVHPDHWRSGYGAALCSAALEHAAEVGYEELTLWVVDLNVEAHDFYSAQGFVPDGATTIDEGASNETVVTARRYRISVLR